MSIRNQYIDIKDARNMVVRVLKEFGSLNYSRLLMVTELPQDILEKTLNLLMKDEVIARENDDDPRYRLTSRGISGLWPFS
jgi:DNA-binding HxlR family transcriptional regulator